MNIQFLKEIEDLKTQNISYQDMSNQLGISKANIVLMERIQKVVSKEYKKSISELENQNKELSEELNLVKKNFSEISELDKIKNLLDENENLKSELEYSENLRETVINLENELNLKNEEIYSLPAIFRFFIRN